MKKNYMKPSAMVVKIETQDVIATSTGIGSEGYGSDAKSKHHRGGSFTDFDFEEEEE